MRFRKSVKITKGVKLNLSKSGPSLTVGPGKGISFNVGSKGAYLNWSIPGTGVYDRVRLDTLAKKYLGFGKDEEKKEERKPAAKSTAKSASKTGAKAAKQPAGPSAQELELQALNEAFVHVGQLAADVPVRRTKAPQVDADAIDRKLDSWLNDVESPIPFAVQTEIVPDKRTVFLDLDLPEIENMPAQKLVTLASGAVKLKAKSQKETREDYRTCVFGLGEYVASHALTLAPALDRAVVSAYTQRRSEKTGETEDVFIYSVVFEREAFKKGYQDEAPEAFCSALRSRYYVLASGVMKPIVPFEPEDIE